jgi:hypothetical protein
MSTEEVVIDLGFSELIPIAGASRNLLNVTAGGPERTEITVTTGWSNTKTKEASMSVTASVGGSYGAANFSVSATVGFGYSDSTSLSKSTSVKQVYSFQPGYITTYYQWGVHVKGNQILNGNVKLEAKSLDELQALKTKAESSATKVKLTLTKVVAPAGAFLIQNVASGYTLMCHSYGKGDCKMEIGQGSIYCPLTAEKVDDNLYRFKNKESGYYLHCDNDGRGGNVRMFQNKHNVCQIFKLVPTGVADYFRLESYNSVRYFMCSRNSGKGKVWMNNDPKDTAGTVMKFVAPRKSYL